MAISGFKQALIDAGISKASFARAAKLNTATVYGWGDMAPAWAFEFLRMMSRIDDLTMQLSVLQRLNQELIHGEHRHDIGA